MFYAHFVLAKKGPLARIWLAAHWDKKLTKAHVFETSIEKSVDGILHPKVKMALRTSGHLLLGVVRIYSRKAKYLLADCNEAFVKIKMAFRPGMVDLPEESREAAVNAITLPEVFHDFDAVISEISDVDIQAQLSMNQSRAEEITMREEYSTLTLPDHNEGFGDLEFDDEGPELLRDRDTGHGSNLFGNEASGGFAETLRRGSKEGSMIGVVDDGFGAPLGQDIMSGGLFEGGLFDETPMDQEPSGLEPTPGPSGTGAGPSSAPHHDAGMDSDDDFGGPPSVGGASSCGLPSPLQAEAPILSNEGDDNLFNKLGKMDENQGDQTTLIHNEEECFALAPIETPVAKGGTRAARRKRKLIVDEVKNISGEEMKSQLSDTSDIVTTLDLAPPTKRLMHWKETGGVEKLFALPGRHIPSRVIARNYQAHLTSRPAENEEFILLNNENQEPNDGPPSLQPILAPLSPKVPPLKVKRTATRGSKRKALEPLEEQHRDGTYSANDIPPVLSLECDLPTDSHQQTPASSMLGGLNATLPPSGSESAMGTFFGNDGNDGSLPNMTLGGSNANNASVNMSLMENMGYDGPADLHQTAASVINDLPLNSVLPTTPWGGDGDYDFPASVGPAEEQAPDETIEQYEERVLNKRAAQMYHIIKSKLDIEPNLSFSTMCNPRNTRKQVAQKFYTLLVLKKAQAVELIQNSSYDNITVTKGPKYDTASL